MSNYRLQINTAAEGMLRPDSNEARKYCGPLLGPQAMGTLSVMYNLVEENLGIVEPTSKELAARIGLSEDRFAKTLDRLAGFGLVEIGPQIDGMTEVAVASWIDPPRTTWRDAHYPPELQEEFGIFVAAAERSRATFQQLVEPEPAAWALDL